MIDSKNSFLISVIIPIFNVEKYLAKCIDSVINQTYKNIEIILVDDGSTDNSYSICKTYEQIDNRIILLHKENGGLSDARNAGLKISHGKYVYFLDSDDWIQDDAIEQLVSISHKNELDLLFFGAECYDEFDEPIEDLILNSRYRRIHVDNEVRTGPDLFLKMIKDKEYFSCVPMIFINKEAICHSFEIMLHEDELFTIQLIYNSKRAMCTDLKLYKRRFRTGSITTQKMTIRNLEGYEKLINYLLSLSEKDTAIVIYCRKMYQSFLRVYFDLNNEERKIAKSKKKIIDHLIKNNHYLGNRKLWLLVSFPGIYRIAEKQYILLRRIKMRYTN